MKKLQFSRIHILAFFCGFLSLCVEMFWIRYIGFIRQGDPYTLGFVLSAFLLGIAGGAQYGKRLCKQANEPLNLLNTSGWWLYIVALFMPLATSLYANNPSPIFRDPILFILIAISSLCYSIMFPIVHHLGVAHVKSDSTKLGRQFSGVYCSNVFGATLGPLFTGYVLMTWLSTTAVLYFISTLTWLLALVYLRANSTKKQLLFVVLSFFTVMLILSLLSTQDWLIKSASSRPDLSNMKIIETRQGIITVHRQERTGDVVLGGNIYDGTTNLDLKINSNGLERPLLMMALHEKPKRVLMVGLSIGSWLTIVSQFPGVEHIDVIEINPGYLKAIEDYPSQSAVLKDPRIKLHIHDARRWLRINSQERYDAVFMNTTFHWRNNASLLLSKDFLELIENRMNPNAVLAFNATGSIDALSTAKEVFHHAYRYGNFIYAANWDFTARKSTPEALKKYLAIELNGKKLIDDENLAAKFLGTPFVDIREAQKIAGRLGEVITDQNMINEFKYGRR